MSWTSSSLSWLSLGCTAIAAVILLWFLVGRPALKRGTKLILLLGFGAFPIAGVTAGNVVAIQNSARVEFCGSCHVMKPWTDDLANPRSKSLASLHGRNHNFGDHACYTCHADYGRFSTVKAKAAGMGHVYEYAREYRRISTEEAIRSIETARPYPNANCTQCHSMTLPGFTEVRDHVSLRGELRAGRVSCASNGCHGPAHPFSKDEEERSR